MNYSHGLSEQKRDYLPLLWKPLTSEHVECWQETGRNIQKSALLKNLGFIDSGGHFHTFPLEGAQNTLIQGVLQ